MKEQMGSRLFIAASRNAHSFVLSYNVLSEVHEVAALIVGDFDDSGVGVGIGQVQAYLIGLSLAYEINHKPESVLWPIIGRFFRSGLAYLKTWTGLKAYLQVYITLRPSNSSFESRDIVVKEKGGFLQRIHETHAKNTPLQYPLLFPFGDDQYQEHIELNELTSIGSVKKRVRVSVRGFFHIEKPLLPSSVSTYSVVIITIFNGFLVLLQPPLSIFKYFTFEIVKN
ncbi:transmembrane protein, putative [Medicago truncatula]|uniref:Transmembrane protein, putative n=1 Tax=Medicago truncatula TaxID=3880 RepID=G7KIB2_MEDTR|nr:transmembrane protein, putative [Medicago truncatula]